MRPAAYFCLLLMLLLPMGRTTSQEPILIECPELTECSGMAVSPSDSSLVWAHNDSGHLARLYLLHRATGALRGMVQLEGVSNGDWEDICAVQIAGKNYLAIGDTGDNHRRRDRVQIHLLEEPITDTIDDEAVQSVPQAGITVQKVRQVLTLDISFPGGSVDCEGLAYDGANKRFVLVTKEFLRCRVCAVPFQDAWLNALAAISEVGNGLSDGDNRSSTQPGALFPIVQAEHIQSLLVPLVTAADIRTEDQMLALCTYGPAYLLQPDGLRWKERSMQRIALPGRKQGESLAFAGSDELVISSEHPPAPLWNLRIAKPASQP
jgi:hypothetical protein